MASCVAEPGATVSVVEITMGADVVELLYPPKVAWFRRSPPVTAGGIAVLPEVLLCDEGELFGFNGVVVCNRLEELAVASISAFLPLTTIPSQIEMSAWSRSVDGSGVIISSMGADREGS